MSSIKGNKFDFVVILSCGRSGSTLLQRVLNTIDGYNICGENYGAIEDLLLFYHKLKYSDRFIPRETNDLRENNELTYRFSLVTRAARTACQRSNQMLYQECIDKKIKPCWYNTFDLSLVKHQIQNLILNMFNPLTEINALGKSNLFEEERKYRVVGFKEIRFGMNEPYTEGELFEKLPVFSRDKEGLEIILDLLEELFPRMGIIVNTRNIDDISKSGWWRGLESKKTIFLQQNLLISCARRRKNAYIIDYSDVCTACSGASHGAELQQECRGSVNNLEGLFKWLNESYDKEVIQKVLDVKL